MITEAERHYINHEMPMIITFHVGGPSDEWLRRQIRGRQDIEIPPSRFQQVIVQGAAEADRVVHALTRLKRQLGLPYGGSAREQWKP